MARKLAFRSFRSIQCRIPRQSHVRRTFLFTAQAGTPLVRSLFASLTLLVVAMAVPVAAAQKIQLSVDVSKPGAKIDRNIFGQFAEHLGHGVYESIWVGPDSKIPNTRGIRNDVVAALKTLKVPDVRWPGGCFADEYHWRKGIGPQRTVTLNPNWGGVIEPNTFGTHEFMDFLDQIGAEAYPSVNVCSGTPQEAAEWLEYLTTAQPKITLELAPKSVTVIAAEQ
jgi:alpha-N-arabinofuranosidase